LSAVPSDAPAFTAPIAAATPIAILASDAVLLTLVGAAVAQRAFALAGYMVVIMLVPWAPRERIRRIGEALAYGGIVWCLYAGLRVPMGARLTELYLPAIMGFIARIRGLRAASVRRWIRFPTSVSAIPGDPEEAMKRALSAPAGDHGAIDAALVALAFAPRAAIPEAEADRRAFWINVYNTLALHAGRGREGIRFFLVREVFRTRYSIAGVPLTLDEIEHGLLRDGAAHPHFRWVRMGRADPRRSLAVPLDPRIHFALHCGAASSPPLRVYRGAELDAQLDLAEQSFLTAVTRWDAKDEVIETSRLLSWYAADFGGEQGVRARLARGLGLPMEETRKARLVFSPFDWTSVVA
jgi:hypothetical protein